MSSSRHHYCTICEKNYSSRQSLSRHKKTFHTNVVIESTKIPQNGGKMAKISTKIPQNSDIIHQNTTKNLCKYCKKTFSRSDSLNRHLKICKEKDNIDDMKNEYETLKKELLKLIKKRCKIHPKTLEKMCRDNNITIDNSIINNQKTINNNQKTINNNQTNNITNNVQILSFGYEGDAIHETLTKKEKINILKSGRGSLLQLVKHVHFNDDLPQFKNFAITNLNNPYAYRYNSDKQQFLACTKEELLEELIDMRTMDIDEFYNTYGNRIDDNKKRAIEKLIKDMEDYEGKEYAEMKHQFKFLVYNSTKNIEIEN